jgi:hypothetical protein
VDGAKKFVGGTAWIRIVKRCFSPCSGMSASYCHRPGARDVPLPTVIAITGLLSS